MILKDYISVSNILFDPPSTNRWDLIKHMVRHITKNKTIESSAEEGILAALTEREKSMSTGIGGGIAIPHCCIDSVKNPVIAIAINHKGMNFDSIDDKPVFIIIMIVVPSNKQMRHIKYMAEIAKLLNNESTKTDILEKKKPLEIFNIFQNIDGKK